MSTAKTRPIFLSSYKFHAAIDPLSYISHRVKDFNESGDIFVGGGKGKGKSSNTLSAMLWMSPKLIKQNPETVLNGHMGFKTKERNEKVKDLHPGDVFFFDEQGTAESGSSYDWNKKENKMYADQNQLDRTNRIINFGVSLDAGRVVKRVRDTYSYMLKPEEKLGDRENEGRGMATRCRLFQKITPFHTGEIEYLKAFNYAKGGRISFIRLPHPPKELWNEYMRRREAFKADIDSREFLPRTKQNVDTDREY